MGGIDPVPKMQGRIRIRPVHYRELDLGESEMGVVLRH